MLNQHKMGAQGTNPSFWWEIMDKMPRPAFLIYKKPPLGSLKSLGSKKR
jgi:hypothetical protein